MAGRRIEIRGTVQGVGFRPWVYRVARIEGVVGRVRNDPRGVTIEAFAADSVLDRFIEQLQTDAPSPASVAGLRSVSIPEEELDGFVIESSGGTGDKALSIPPDLATCNDCGIEVFDPNNRRYGYAFTNCTRCGPRFTIATGIPYDRAATTMSTFEMCTKCRGEYDDVEDRRFHAQPNACPECGPRLRLVTPGGKQLAESDDVIDAAAAALRRGEILAAKGLGGFHLMVAATNATGTPGNPPPDPTSTRVPS